MHDRLLRAQQMRMAHGAAHDPAQHVAAPLIGELGAITQREGHRAHMVCDDGVVRELRILIEGLIDGTILTLEL